jgi:hypothetical protein
VGRHRVQFIWRLFVDVIDRADWPG